jgi:hypothetical protein
MDTDFNNKLAQSFQQVNAVTDKLASKLIENRSEVEERVEKLEQAVNAADNKVVKISDGVREVRELTERTSGLQTRQGERFELINQEIVKEKSVTQNKFDKIDLAINGLREKLSVGNYLNRTADSIPAREISDNVRTPPTTCDAVANGDHNSVSNVTCTCQLDSCSMCARGSVNVESMNVAVRPPSACSYLGKSDFPLPQYDVSAGTNPVFHIKQLDEFMKLRGIPKAHQLAIAFRSITGVMGKQWLETVSHKLTDYGDFKAAFLQVWWSAAQQSLARCNLYQGRYNRQSNLTLSGHFLQYATLGSYLDPRPSDPELIEAIRYHFPIGVQRAMLSNQLRTVAEALDLLRRIEIIESGESYNRPGPSTQNQTQNPDRRNPNPHPNDRPRSGQQYVRNVQNYYGPRAGHWDNRNQRGSNPHNNDGNNQYHRGAGGQNLNPHAPTFSASDGPRREDQAGDNSGPRLGN